MTGLLAFTFTVLASPAFSETTRCAYLEGTNVRFRTAETDPWVVDVEAAVIDAERVGRWSGPGYNSESICDWHREALVLTGSQ